MILPRLNTPAELDGAPLPHGGPCGSGGGGGGGASHCGWYGGERGPVPPPYALSGWLGTYGAAAGCWAKPPPDAGSPGMPGMCGANSEAWVSSGMRHCQGTTEEPRGCDAVTRRMMAS